jgi:hypothetical protein
MEGRAMTVTVSAYTRESKDAIVELPLHSEVAGFDSARETFYASERAVAGGLRLLPMLRDQVVLEVCGDDLQTLKHEVEFLRAGLSEEEAKYWEIRLDNIMEAIEVATNHGSNACVSIG